jgi:poly(A) polymerase
MGSPNRTSGQQRWLGITEPISLSGPTEYDVAKTRELEKVLFLRLISELNIYFFLRFY